MICDVCHKNEANVYITKIVNGKKEELHLCQECAKSMEGFEGTEDFTFEPFTFQNLLSGIMDYMISSSPKPLENSSKLVCKNCGMSYSEFKKKGFLGCSECYESFNKMLSSVIKRVQGNVEHIGKVPRTSGKDIVKRRNLIDLKEQLQKCIATEEYEKAAEIRDKIKELEKED